ncbi:hypothetical protein C1645_842599 [Glomus cerebriforme]|uniref:Uncharacterized protein n=1 Tax=Glomus cerebriforme TaxID=658196 RepID=A0A397RWG7_9GLOM|nr:hypothetical protein C1645_842599 [Glomus cerebriforme]
MAKVRVNNARNQPVPRESVYDSELYRVLWNWLIIRSPYGQVIVLELLATATEGELNEHYNRVLNYARLLVANESWIVHFTCEDDYNKKPLWPSDALLKQNLLVVHFCHDIDFKRVDMTVCWWNSKRNIMSTYQHSMKLD